MNEKKEKLKEKELIKVYGKNKNKEKIKVDKQNKKEKMKKKFGKLQFFIKILFQELLNIYVILSKLRNIYDYSIFIN